MQLSDDGILRALYEKGAIYDSRRYGFARSLHLTCSGGEWEASWRNSPDDSFQRVSSGFSSPMSAIKWLLVQVCEANRRDAEEIAAE